MNAAFKIDINGLLPFKRQMQLLAMPKPMRRRLLNKVAKKVISASKKRVRNQVDLNGNAFKKHAKGRKRKMLGRIVRQLKVTNLSSTRATVGFVNSMVERIAAKQQHGSTETVTAQSFNKTSEGNRHYDKPATRKQARALRDAGYLINKRKSKNGKKPSLKWVTQNLTVGIAGLIIKKLRIDAGEKMKQRWSTKIPARAFLGATAREVTQHTEQIMKQMTQEIQHGQR